MTSKYRFDCSEILGVKEMVISIIIMIYLNTTGNSQKKKLINM